MPRTYIPHPYIRKQACVSCQVLFVARAPNARYCVSCYKVQEQNKKSPYLHLSSGTVGAIGELMVSVDLMKKGYEVFRALSPSCSCDLAILKDKKLLRIEVRTGYFAHPSEKQKQRHKADVLAVIIHKTNTIVYSPDLTDEV